MHEHWYNIWEYKTDAIYDDSFFICNIFCLIFMSQFWTKPNQPGNYFYSPLKKTFSHIFPVEIRGWVWHSFSLSFGKKTDECIKHNEW